MTEKLTGKDILLLLLYLPGKTDKKNEPPNLYSYRLAEKGIKYVEENILENISEQQKEYLRKFKRKINTLSLDSILSYVYNKYPNAAENSLIRSDYIAEAGADND
jgi:DNA primase catalytic subunit